MLTEEQIRDALHAHRVLPLPVANPHGPLGLEQLAEAVARLHATDPVDATERVERLVSLPRQTWQKLDELARSTSRGPSRTLTGTDIAAVIVEAALNGK